MTHPTPLESVKAHRPARAFVSADGHRLEYLWLQGSKPQAAPLVFLHEGLGCISTWRDFPAHLVAATGHSALVYSRYGYGHSDVLREKRAQDYLEKEALVTLPRVLCALNIRNPILVGHSDGASIALIYAAAHTDLQAAVVMAPHEVVEDALLQGMQHAKHLWDHTDWRTRLARHHDDVDGTFAGWYEVWTAPQRESWEITKLLAHIQCPVLAIQGKDDEYASLLQMDLLAQHVARLTSLILPHCRHSAQFDQKERVIQAIVQFISLLPGGKEAPPARS